MCNKLRAGILPLLLVLFLAAGCGGSSSQGGNEETLAEKAMRAAFGAQRAEFVSLVAPSFLEEARREMPDTDDETLGGVFIAGFLNTLPFAGIVDAKYRLDVQGEKAVVHVWGLFLGSQGEEISIPEAQAVRIPIIKENGRWYLDLLDL
jgi:hypothetical protein